MILINIKNINNKMKKFTLIICIAGFLAPIGLNAQKVYKLGEMVILDMTVEAGMPAGAVTDVSKTQKYNADSVIPNDYELTEINGVKNDVNHPLNAKVYQKLGISKLNSGAKSWVEAFNYCKGIDEDGTWRLPTQRELMMMYIFKSALVELLDNSFFNSSYWSTTELDNTNTWSCNSLGNLTWGSKSNNILNSRCVREIIP